MLLFLYTFMIYSHLVMLVLFIALSFLSGTHLVPRAFGNFLSSFSILKALKAEPCSAIVLGNNVHQFFWRKTGPSTRKVVTETWKTESLLYYKIPIFEKLLLRNMLSVPVEKLHC